MAQIKAKLPLIGDEYYGNPSKRFRFKGKVPTFTDLPNTNGRVFNGDTYYVIDEDETYFFDEGEFKKVEINIDGDAFYEDLGFPKFYESKDYEKDNVVVKYGKLYKFTEPHAAGPWTGTDVTKTTISELISSGEYPDIIAGDLTPKSNTPVATTIKMAVATTGGDIDIKSGAARIKAIRGNLAYIDGKYYSVDARYFVSTGMNLVNPDDVIQYGVHGVYDYYAYYFPVKRGAWGAEGTTQENNGYVVFGDVFAVGLFADKPTRQTLPEEPETDVEYVTDSKGIKHYLPSYDGWLVLYTLPTADVPGCHITWSGTHDRERGMFLNSIVELPQATQTFDSFIGIYDVNRSSYDEINFVLGKRYKRIGWDALSQIYDWTITEEPSGEGEEDRPTYVFSRTFERMKPNGLIRCGFPFTVNGNSLEWRSTTVSDLATFYHLIEEHRLFYELAEEVEEDIEGNGMFVANDFGLMYFTDGSGEIRTDYPMYVDFEFQQGGKEQLFNAVTYQKTLAEVIATALCDLDRRLHALEGVRDTVECTNLIVNRSALIANGMTAVATRPASATANGNVGDFFMNTTHLYICVAPNTWRRVAISTF